MKKTTSSASRATVMSNMAVETETEFKNHWLQDIQAIYSHAMNHEMYAIALRAKALMAQAHGWLGKSVNGAKSTLIKPVCQWTPDDVNSILEQLAKYDTPEEG
jgi:hypothetical protein